MTRECVAHFLPCWFSWFVCGVRGTRLVRCDPNRSDETGRLCINVWTVF